MHYYRVTEILYPFSGLKFVDSQVLENAAVRGTKVHNICEGIVKGLEPWDIEENLSGYVDSFKKWWRKGHEVLAVEKRFYCEDLGITGQVDLILKTPKGDVICDLKTSQQESKSWLLQGSAYSYMASKSGYSPKTIMFLRLKRDGSYPKEHFYAENMDLFRKTLDVFEYFHATKKQLVERGKV